MFFPKFWSQGFALEAITAIVQHCVNSLNIIKLIAISQKANRRSCALLEKAGFQHVKDFERFNALQGFYEFTNVDS